MKTGIILLNFGGPWTLADVKPFLYKLFSDPAILTGLPAPFRQMVAFAISQLKGSSSIESYAAIGGGSPQLKWTELQAAGVRDLLARDSVRIEIGMRSAEPSIEQALLKLKEWGAERLVALPLFPQYSTTTTGTCFTAMEEALTRLQWRPPVQSIRNWPDHPDYASLLRSLMDETIRLAEQERINGSASDPIHVLFSAHSLPLSIVKKGDPYPQDVERTIRAVTQELSHPWSLCYQSRNGPLPWLSPYTESAIEHLGKSGIKRLVVTPISFVSDHIETLWELDRLYSDIAKKNGITHYYRVRTFNDDPRFAQLLRTLLSEHGL
jgi:ferrochelatase